jgi:hypothetical protein
MAPRGFLHPLFQLGKRIGFGTDAMSESFGNVTAFRGFLYHKDYLLFHISLVDGTHFLNPDLAGH